MLTYGGKVVLIKSVMLALPTYILTFINSPSVLLILFKNTLLDFFGVLMAIDLSITGGPVINSYYPKEEEGISIRNMHDISCTLAIKGW